MRFVNLKNIQFYYFLFLSSIIGILNIVTKNSLPLSSILLVFQILILTILFFSNNHYLYLAHILVFTTFSFEFDYYSLGEKIYGFKSAEIFGVNLPILCLFPTLIYIFLNLSSIEKYLNKFKVLYGFTRLLIMMNLLSIIMLIINLLGNTNSINTIDNTLTVAFQQIYLNVIIVSLPYFSFLYIITKGNYNNIKVILVAILFSLINVQLFSYITQSYSIFAGSSIISVPITTIFTTFFPLLVFFVTKSNVLKTVFYSFLSIFLLFLQPIMGKQIIAFFIMLLIFIFILYFKKMKYKNIYLSITLILLVIFACLSYEYVEQSPLLMWKLNQVIELLDFSKPNWILNLSMSPRVRVEEFFGILIDYFHNPVYLLTGKGLMGTFHDSRGYLISIDKRYVLSAFSIWEWKNGYFYSVHEAVNKLLLVNGFFGLLTLFILLKTYILNFHKSIFLTIGVFWFLSFYGYSVTLSVYGIVCLIIGFVEIES